MAAPTLGSLVQASATSGTKTWTLTQGTYDAMVGIMLRDSQYMDSRGTWGGLSVSTRTATTASSSMPRASARAEAVGTLRHQT